MPHPVKPDDVDKLKYWYRSKQFVIDNNLPITVVDVVPNFTILTTVGTEYCNSAPTSK
jgi:hypothetical protein